MHPTPPSLPLHSHYHGLVFSMYMHCSLFVVSVCLVSSFGFLAIFLAFIFNFFASYFTFNFLVLPFLQHFCCFSVSHISSSLLSLFLFLSYCFLPLCFSFLFLVEPTSHSAIVRTQVPVFFFVLPPSLLMETGNGGRNFYTLYYHSYCCEGYYKLYCCVESGALWPCLRTDVCMVQRKCTTYGKPAYSDIRGAYDTLSNLRIQILYFAAQFEELMHFYHSISDRQQCFHRW